MTDLTPTILIEIRDDVRSSEERLTALIAQSRTEVIAQTRAAIEQLSATMSDHWNKHEEWLKDHDARIRDLERGGRRRPHPPRR